MTLPDPPDALDPLHALDAAIDASWENHWDDQERNVVTPKPELTRLRMLRGTARLEAKRYAEALEDLNFVLMPVTDDADALSNHGMAHRHLGALDQALADYARAIACRPDGPNAYLNRGNLYRQQGRLADAKADYLRAFERAPGYTGARDNWIAVRREQGKPVV